MFLVVHYISQGFSALAKLTFGDDFVVEAVLCSVGCVAASTCQMPTVPLPSCDNQKIMFWRQNHLWLRTTDVSESSRKFLY